MAEDIVAQDRDNPQAAAATRAPQTATRALTPQTALRKPEGSTPLCFLSRLLSWLVL